MQSFEDRHDGQLLREGLPLLDTSWHSGMQVSEALLYTQDTHGLYLIDSFILFLGTYSHIYSWSEAKGLRTPFHHTHQQHNVVKSRNGNLPSD